MMLHHVQVVGPPGCEEPMRRFYGNLLGLDEVAKPPELGRRGGVWFRGPGYELHVSPDDGFVPARRAHPAFCVDDDLDGLAGMITEAGHEVTYDSDFIGYRRFHTFDPYGNRVEIMQPLGIATTDLCDERGQDVDVCQQPWVSYGGRRTFDGPAVTIRCLDDNTLIKEAVAEPGRGQVLVVDGGGSTRTALLGDQVAGAAAAHGWAGIVVHGCVRDSAALARVDVGVLALDTCPRRSSKHGDGEREVAVTIAGVRFESGAHVWCDRDGVVVETGAGSRTPGGQT